MLYYEMNNTLGNFVDVATPILTSQSSRFMLAQSCLHSCPVFAVGCGVNFILSSLKHISFILASRPCLDVVLGPSCSTLLGYFGAVVRLRCSVDWRYSKY
jgi:hypothetical protein